MVQVTILYQYYILMYIRDWYFSLGSRYTYILDCEINNNHSIYDVFEYL